MVVNIRNNLELLVNKLVILLFPFISGSIAAATGTMRVFNKKHWVSDVVAGAGIGILSAEAGYMLLPVWHNILGIKGKNKNLVIVPNINPESAGIGLTYTF